ncbi:MAG: GrpB family protein [Candidatus Bathyarchaeota archaeon]|nr:GrpB family protein [Candidatus Bathyarchaeota archaeon]
MPVPITIHPYNSKYPQFYFEEKEVVLGALGDRILSIDHIGSTAVPGMPCKAIIDIIGGVASKEIAEDCVGLLLSVNYDDITVENHPEWFYCLGKPLQSVYCHLHIVLEGSEHHRNHILLRDYLRGHSDIAREYADLKIGMAERFSNDRFAYTEAKTVFITKIIAKAKLE